MPQIHLLDKSVAELIAAGEVVERPASVIKELVENSIDAGATKITVEIRRGGISYIRITDDGCGIPGEDVPKAFLRHATSKVYSAEDLSRIGTFGFRGEALASVAAMCKVELLSRTADSVSGTRYAIQGGEQVAYEEAGCAVGTTITVRDIFYNTPARMKFLKKDATEGMNVSNVLEKIALSNPGVSFKFIKDGEVKLTTPGNGDLLATIHGVLGREFAAGLLPVESTIGSLVVKGYISSPKSARASRTMQNFFINGRFVKSKTCAAALEEAYRSCLMVGKYPACVLDVSIPLETVDVNVHPAKIEVRFSNEKLVFDGVLAACKDALGTYERDTFALAGGKQPSAAEKKLSPFALKDFDHTQRQQRFSAQAYREMVSTQPEEQPRQPTFSSGRAESNGQKEGALRFSQQREVVPYRLGEQRAAAPLRGQPMTQAPLPGGVPCPDGEPMVLAGPPRGASAPMPELVHNPPPAPPEPVVQREEAPLTSEAVAPHARLVGEIFTTYILVEYGEQFLFIDKHAAHERYLYNQLKARQGDIERQLLLTPLPVSLSKLEYDAAVSHGEVFRQFGLLVEDFGEGTVLVREAPVLLTAGEIPAVVEEISGKLLAAKTDVTPHFLDELYHSIACRSAIKGGDRSSAWELEELVKLIEQSEDIHYCPHGRPVLFAMSRSEIEKRFGRLG